jgi:geranylgeranyl pyrophosphate synthase
MPLTAGSLSSSAVLVDQVRRLTLERLADALTPLGEFAGSELLGPGKLVRTQLAARLLEALPESDPHPVKVCCAATELVHTGSLCHDDVIDGGLVRRSLPALWRKTSASAAILIGDLLVCESIRLVLSLDEKRWSDPFMSKLQHTIGAEARQELNLRGQPVDDFTCLHVARCKTGGLFSFTAMVCGGDDPEFTAALEECGYRIGTAYQLADDLLDHLGSPDASGKTLGTDALRGKHTLAGQDESGIDLTRRHIYRLCGSALETMHPWPGAQQAVSAYLADDLQPVLARQNLPLDLMEATRVAEGRA